jgi:hypothetical protein
MSKRAPKASAASPSTSQPRPPEGSNRTLRSGTASARLASSTPTEASTYKAPAPRSKATQNATASANLEAEEEDEDLYDTDSESSALFIIANQVTKLLDNYNLPEVIEGKLRFLARYATKMGVREGKQDTIQASIGDLREIRKSLILELSGKFDAFEDKLSHVEESQAQILKATVSLTKKTEGIDAAAKGIVDKVTEVNAATTQIACTTKTYKDALLVQPSQTIDTMVDLRIKDDLERKAKQVLVEVLSDDLKGKSLAEIKLRATDAIAELDDDQDRPEQVVVEVVTATRTKALLLQMNTKQAANWLRNPLTESQFMPKFAKDSFFVNRTYNIIVPRTPIIFDPKNEQHLREIEEGNNLDPKSVKKARWIKPENRRREGQTHAYAILSLTTPATANLLIRKGITICGAKTLPTKLKHEPMQCLRCRCWGHLIAQCQNPEACGACGDGHSTSDCNNPQKRYCISCRNGTHSSWDRGCPEFIRRCETINNRYPENNLPFFPTDEDWTLTTRPDKIPRENRFPQRYAVNPIPARAAPRRAQQQNQARNKAKHQNNAAASSKGKARGGESNTNTIIKYFSRSQPNVPEGSNAREEGEPPGSHYLDEPANSEIYAVEQLLGDAAPRHIPGWS